MNVYEKIAVILSKDKNATVDDILNTYTQLSNKKDNNNKNVTIKADDVLKQMESSATTKRYCIQLRKKYSW